MATIGPYGFHHPFSSLTDKVLRKYVRSTFIETGTNVGLGVEAALRCGFKRVISIEFDLEMFLFSSTKFSSNERVELHHGDSAVALHRVLQTITGLATVYLDAHAVGYNPLLQELEALRNFPMPGSVVMIDDVRMFGSPDWLHISEHDIITGLRRLGTHTITYEDTPNASRDLLVAVY